MLKGLLLPLRGYLSTPPRSICHHLSLAGIQSVTTESRLQPRNLTDGGSILTGTWRHRRSSSALVLPPANSGALNRGETFRSSTNLAPASPDSREGKRKEKTRYCCWATQTHSHSIERHYTLSALVLCPLSNLGPQMADPSVLQLAHVLMYSLPCSVVSPDTATNIHHSKPPWVHIGQGKACAGVIASSINTRFPSWSLPSFLIHFTTTSYYYLLNHFHTTCSSFTTPYSTDITKPSSSLTTSRMSSIFDNCNTNDFYCEGRSDPSIDIGVRYYPDRDQWSPVFNPNVVPDNNADGDKAPIDAVGDKTPIDVKPTMDAKDKGPAEATVDPASINTILACSASLVYIPKGMEIVETRTHYFPLKDKWHAINDPSRHYDCSSIPDKVPIPRLFPKPHPFVCVPWNVHDPELPPGLPVPFLRTLNLPVPVPTPAPSTSSSESSSNDSDSSSTYPLISNYINLNHQGVQKLLLDDNTPPTAVCIYTEEDVMRIFEGIAPEYVDMCSEYPPSSLAESDRRVMFFENMQWFFRNKRSTYLSTRKF
ncbi:hypothetical protein PGTUg99_026437 [Puccinia graminis f. sp. tritici]|uniref:Uncharacterized protein n=1 Tax=Puccinia graminis f. sp. tritici TaxID=56615 RepID=A0A5B0NHM2_PUCGR|nr:hypothetical protein PGTUg99_026437 [Puccinia graminis f. sp. tritici]